MNQSQWQPGGNPQADDRGEQNPFAPTGPQSASTGASPGGSAKRGFPAWLVIVLSVVIVVLVIAMAVVLFGQRLWAGGAGDSETVAPVTTTENFTAVEENPVTNEPTECVDTAEPEPAARPEYPDLPGAVVPANGAAAAGLAAGDFNNVYKSGPTSDAFALAVRDDFVEQFLATGDTSAVLNTYSSVTGTTYQMDCRDNGDYVHCTGGNDANVYIA